MTGAVPATNTCCPTRTARENPITGSYGEPEAMSCRSISLVSNPRGRVANRRGLACRARGGRSRLRAGPRGRARRPRTGVPLGVGDEAGDRGGVSRRGRGGRDRPRRGGRPAGLDVPASARPRLRAAARGREPDRSAGGAANLLRPRLRRPRRRAGRACRNAVRGLSPRGRDRPARPPRALRRPAGIGRVRLARRAARADAGRAGDARRGDVGAVPRAGGRAARLRPAGAERLGPRLRAARRQVAALDRRSELTPDVRPLRPQRHLPLGRPGGRGGARLSDRPRLRRLGCDGLAGAVRRRAGRAVSGRAARTAVTGLSLSLLLTACGTATQKPTTAALVRPGDLTGWAAVDDPPGISQLAPDLSGLAVIGRADTKALVKGGDAIRTSTLTFATAKDAAEARRRGA